MKSSKNDVKKNEDLETNQTKNEAVSNNSSNKVIIGLLIALVIIFVFIAVLLCFILFDDKNESKNNNQNEVNDKIDSLDKEEEVSITDSEVVRLYNIVSAEKNDYDAYSKDEFLVKDMSSYTRAMIARNVYADKLQFIGENPYFYNGKQYYYINKYEIDEQLVIDAYNSIFGEGYYSNVNDAYCGALCCDMKYDASSKKYAGMQGGCGVEVLGVSFNEYEELTKAVKYSDRLEIEVSVLYVYQNTIEDVSYYSDYGKNKRLPMDNISYDEAKNYQKQNSDSLDKIRYVFKLNNGQYHYYGVYRPNK